MTCPRQTANYSLLLKLFLAGVMRRKILAIAATNPEITPASLLERLRDRPSAKGSGGWVDMAGLLAPREAVDALSAEIVSDGDMSIDEAVSSWPHPWRGSCAVSRPP